MRRGEELMSFKSYEDQYFHLLSSAMRRGITNKYVLSQLSSSLGRIGIDQKCVLIIINLLVELSFHEINGQELFDRVTQFQAEWRPHLNRAYLEQYEETRWDYVQEFVFKNLDSTEKLGRCLDVGCGRGCITSKLIQEGSANEVIGIDEVNYSAEWHERVASAGKAVRFDHVSPSDLDSWLREVGSFDTIFMFYVLHHSHEYWAAHTLHTLRKNLKPNGRLIVVEDSLVSDNPPKSDPYSLYEKWLEWSNAENQYCLSASFDIQAVLDFVAVQLLAGFKDVHMPCCYRLGSEWIEIFNSVGYNVTNSVNIGFPDGRDIDVPQALFEMQRQ